MSVNDYEEAIAGLRKGGFLSNIPKSAIAEAYSIKLAKINRRRSGTAITTNTITARNKKKKEEDEAHNRMVHWIRRLVTRVESGSRPERMFGLDQYDDNGNPPEAEGNGKKPVPRNVLLEQLGFSDDEDEGGDTAGLSGSARVSVTTPHSLGHEKISGDQVVEADPELPVASDGAFASQGKVRKGSESGELAGVTEQLSTVDPDTQPNSTSEQNRAGRPQRGPMETKGKSCRYEPY